MGAQLTSGFNTVMLCGSQFCRSEAQAQGSQKAKVRVSAGLTGSSLLPKCSPGIGSISLTWAHVRNENVQTLPETYWIAHSDTESTNLFWQALQVVLMPLPWGTTPFANLTRPRSGTENKTSACPIRVNVRNLPEAPRRLLFFQLSWSQFPVQMAYNPKWRTCLRMKPTHGRKPSEYLPFPSCTFNYRF